MTVNKLEQQLLNGTEFAARDGNKAAFAERELYETEGGVVELFRIRYFLANYQQSHYQECFSNSSDCIAAMRKYTKTGLRAWRPVSATFPYAGE